VDYIRSGGVEVAIREGGALVLAGADLNSPILSSEIDAIGFGVERALDVRGKSDRVECGRREEVGLRVACEDFEAVALPGESIEDVRCPAEAPSGLDFTALSSWTAIGPWSCSDYTPPMVWFASSSGENR
jgi:hypothetical protein